MPKHRPPHRLLCRGRVNSVTADGTAAEVAYIARGRVHRGQFANPAGFILKVDQYVMVREKPARIVKDYWP